MSETAWCGRGPNREGFTLIEVMGALVIFSLGVLMVIQLSGALSRQMEYAAKSSELVARAQERVDSLEAVPFASLAVGTTQQTVTVRGTSYRLTATVSAVTGVLKKIDVTLAPVTAGTGPSQGVTSYSAAKW